MEVLSELLPLIVSLLGVFVVGGAILASVTTVRYRIDPPFLRISWLGLPVRNIPLQEIRSIGHRPVFWAERWYNSLRGHQRMLVLRRSQGYFRTLIITPKNYLVFKAELERARRSDFSPAELVEAPPSPAESSSPS